MMNRIGFSLAFRLLSLFCLCGSVMAEEFKLHEFERTQLTGVYFSEGANAGDLNGDKVVDVVYGPYWFAGPEYTKKQEIYAPVPQNTEGYSDNFFSWVHDFNDDGWNDLFVVGFPGTPAYLYEHPQADGLGAHWKKHQVFDSVSNESPQLTNIVGDSTPELVCTRDGYFGFATIDPQEPFGLWSFHAISEQVADKRFGHGLGIGDVNSDGKLDIIHSGGWFEQPDANADTTRWLSHAAAFTTAYGGAEMFAYDVDGDGDSDIITSNAAHHFGLAWYEQVGAGDEISFHRHLIMGAYKLDERLLLVLDADRTTDVAAIAA